MAVQGIFYVLVHVRDFERSKRFYAETLGWRLGTDEPGIAGFQFGSAYLVVHADDRPAMEQVYGGGLAVCVQVDDAFGEHARLTRAGLEVGPVRDEPWGERSFQFADPDGYLWRYGQALHGQHS